MMEVENGLLSFYSVFFAMLKKHAEKTSVLVSDVLHLLEDSDDEVMPQIGVATSGLDALTNTFDSYNFYISSRITSSGLKSITKHQSQDMENHINLEKKCI